MKLTIRTAEEVQAEALARHKAAVSNAVDARIEEQARALYYNSAAHLVGYANSQVPQWREESLAFIAWRDTVWLTVLGVLDQAMATGNIPSVDDVLGQLPDWTG